MTKNRNTAPDVSLGEAADLASAYRDDDFANREADPDEEGDGWDERYTPITLAFGPVMRDGYAVMPGDRCIGHLPLNAKDITVTDRIPCPVVDEKGRPTRAHQFHMATSKGRDGRYVGPEANNLRALIGKVVIDKAIKKDGSEEVVRTFVKGGYVAYTREAETRTIETARVAAERYPDPGAQPPTVEQIRAQFAASNALMDNPVEQLRRERQEARTEADKLAEKLREDRKELAVELSVAIAQAFKDMASADAK